MSRSLARAFCMHGRSVWPLRGADLRTSNAVCCGNFNILKCRFYVHSPPQLNRVVGPATFVILPVPAAIIVNVAILRVLRFLPPMFSTTLAETRNLATILIARNRGIYARPDKRFASFSYGNCLFDALGQGTVTLVAEDTRVILTMLKDQPCQSKTLSFPRSETSSPP